MKIYPSAFKSDILNQIKPGKILVAQKLMDDELLNKSVILLLEHDETGSTGLILNKSGISPGIAGATTDDLICYGGTYDTHRVGVILDNEHLAKKAIRIADGIYYSENCNLFQEKDFRAALNAASLKAFIGFTVWQAGQLEQEISANRWWIDEFDATDLKTKSAIGLWEEKIVQLNNQCGVFYNNPSLFLN